MSDKKNGFFSNLFSLNKKKSNKKNKIEEKNENNFLFLLKNYLKNTKEKFSKKIKELFFQDKLDSNLLNKLEKILLLSDVGVKTTKKIINQFKISFSLEKNQTSEKTLKIFKNQLSNIFKKVDSFNDSYNNTIPNIILLVGVNGVGKTSIAAKLAYYFQKKGKSIIFAAADTFRAAAVDQLEEWGNFLKIPVVKKSIGSDPASVVFKSIQKFKKDVSDILIIDTAGRFHNKENLINELKKINKVIKKNIFNLKYDVFLVIDACTGQNAVQQIRSFHNFIGITGIIITKLDGTAKGGIIFSIVDIFSIPIHYVSIGEKITDFRKFNSSTFIKAIF